MTIGRRRVIEIALYGAMLVVGILGVLVAMLFSAWPALVGAAYAYIIAFRDFWLAVLALLLLVSAIALFTGPRNLRARVALWYTSLVAALLLIVLLWDALLQRTAAWPYLLGLAAFALAFLLPVFWLADVVRGHRG